jgi:hypothetical protein
MRTALIWVITQLVVVIPYRRFWSSSQSHLQRSRSHSETIANATECVPHPVDTHVSLDTGIIASVTGVHLWLRGHLSGGLWLTKCFICNLSGCVFMLHITCTTCGTFRTTVFQNTSECLWATHTPSVWSIFLSFPLLGLWEDFAHRTARKYGFINSLHHTTHVINNDLAHNRFLFSVHLRSVRNFVNFHLSGQSLVSISLSLSLVLCYVIRSQNCTCYRN